MSVGISDEHRRIASELVARTRRLNGLAPVDLEKFHADQAVSVADPFGKDIPQCPLGMMGMSEACVFDELGVEEDADRYRDDEEWRFSLKKAYNDKAEKIIGRRPLSEKRAPYFGPHPPRGLHDIFEGKTVWKSGTVWLEQAARDEKDLEALLDRVEKRLENPRDVLLDDEWEVLKKKRREQGAKLPLYRGQRGPVTFATSIYGV
jgi:hypothetical protein